MSTSLSTCYAFVWLVLKQVLCALSPSLWVCVYIDPVMSRRCSFLGVDHQLWLLSFSFSLFRISPWSSREEVFKRHPI